MGHLENLLLSIEKRNSGAEVRSLTMAALPKGACGPSLSDAITSETSSLGS